MWKVEIEDGKFSTKSGVSAKTGKQYSLREQEGWLYGFDRDGKAHKHPQKVSLTLDDDQPGGYPPGLYFVHPSSVYLGRFDRAEIRLRLMPIAEFQTWVSTAYKVSAAPVASGPVNTARAA